MKFRIKYFFILSAILFLSCLPIYNSNSLETNVTDFSPPVPYHCANPTDESNVTQTTTVTVGNATSDYYFDSHLIYANKSTCIKIILKNESPSVYHGFFIDEVGGGNESVVDANLTGRNIDAVEIEVENNSSDVGFGPGLNVFYIATPFVEANFSYYCDEPGHVAMLNERGTLVVGDFYISSSPSIETSTIDLLTTGSTSVRSSSNQSNDHITGTTGGFELVPLVMVIGLIIILKKRLQ